MSKNKKSQKAKNNNMNQKPVENETLIKNEVDTAQGEEVEVQKNDDNKNRTDKQVDKKNKNKDKKKVRETGKLKKKAKETMSELKKVIWPSFGDVVKKTGVVLAVVLVFAVVIFGIDYVLGLLVSLLRK